jgi:hypothetical protein
MLPLPTSDLSFEQIITGKYLYADKSMFAHHLVAGHPPYQITRPEKFGKSLFVDTLIQVLLGRRELFKGLWIDDADYDWEPSPVLYFNFEQLENHSAKAFENSLVLNLSNTAAAHKIAVHSKEPTAIFKSIIEGFHHKNKKSKIAVIIEGYETAVARQLDKEPISSKIWDYLRELYVVLDDPEVISFPFLIGEYVFQTNHTKVGLNFFDVSLEEKFNSICGFTPEEFDLHFSKHLDHALKELKSKDLIASKANAADLREMLFDWYGGYCWDTTNKVLNPYSVLNFFKHHKFESFWYKEARQLSPVFLNSKTLEIDKLMTKKRFISFNTNCIYPKTPIYSTVLFQHGYLAIDHADKSDHKNPEKLFFPNLEVGAALIPVLTGMPQVDVDPMELYIPAKALYKALLAKNGPGVAEAFSQIAAIYPESAGNIPGHYYKTLIDFALGLVGACFKDPPEKSDIFEYIMRVDEFSYILLRYREVEPDDSERLRESWGKKFIRRFIQLTLDLPVPQRKISLAGVTIDYFPGEQKIEVDIDEL